jgi:50S ribosomal subunit-associated GTPase HflX
LLSASQIKEHIEQIIDLIVSKIHNQKQCTPKVIWNLCVATSKIIDTFNKVHKINNSQKYSELDYSKSYLAKMFCFDTTKCFLEIFMDG